MRRRHIGAAIVTLAAVATLGACSSTGAPSSNTSAASQSTPVSAPPVTDDGTPAAAIVTNFEAGISTQTSGGCWDNSPGGDIEGAYQVDGWSYPSTLQSDGQGGYECAGGVELLNVSTFHSSTDATQAFTSLRTGGLNELALYSQGDVVVEVFQQASPSEAATIAQVAKSTGFIDVTS